ncbi:hypothetical protein EWD52_23450 [Salmonella enterica subsp. enterica serovar Braenderup]|nr:hypothetical protein [Salmonella enterica subsp. enterica serovar Braenderup]ECD1500255.1 hypothetical protein [Salmonella enterica subsp. enterica serovar Braenderup]
MKDGVIAGSVAVFPASNQAGKIVQAPLNIYPVDNPTGEAFKSIEDYTAFVDKNGEAIAQSLNK